MQKMQEIVRVLGRKRLKRIEVFNESGNLNRKSLYYRFYQGIRDGKFKTDEDAARELCETDPSDKKYLMLKSRVRNRLMNNLFFLERSGAPYEQAIYRCNRNLLAAKFLQLNGARRTLIGLLKSTLQEAGKYQITEVELECLRLLRIHTGFMGQHAEFEKYHARFLQVRMNLDAEYLSEEYYERLILPFAKSQSPKPWLAEVAIGYMQHLEELRKYCTSHVLTLNYYRIRIMAYSICNQYDEVIIACDEAEQYLMGNPHLVQKIRFGEFALKRMVAQMHQGDYESGKESAEASLRFYQEGSNNWMIFLEYYFLLCMHTGNYDKAGEIFQRVVRHPRFAQIDDIRAEKWKIFEAFLNYMLTGDDGEEDTEARQQQRFNIFKFLNEVPIYSRDKRGLNIAILILQVLFLLDRKDFGGIISRTEALKVYCSRYLKRDENYRSNCFLKMVLAMEKKDFNGKQTQKITSKYFRRLKSARFQYEGNLATLEIIPYEQLWQSILQKLN